MLAALAPYLLLALCAVPWALLIAPRFGGRLAATTVVAGAPLLVLAVLSLTGVLHLPGTLVLLGVTAALGVLGLVLLHRTGPALPSRSSVLVWLAAGIGGLLWLAVLALALVLPNADPLSWAMGGDATNNIHNARSHLVDGGINPGRGITVPLVSALLSVSLALGRPESGASELLAHVLLATSTLFALVLGVAGTLLGVVAASLLRSARGRAVAAALASLLGCTWLVAGLPIESGYLNGPISVALLLLAWLAFLDARRAPVYSLSLQLGIAILVMTTWSPLLVISVALIAATLLRSWVVVRVLKGRAAIPLVIAILAILGITAVTLGPALIGNSSVFGTPGHGFPSTIGVLAVASIVALVLATLRRRQNPGQFDGVIAVVVGSLAGTITLLVLAAPTGDPLGAYYPAKLGWMLTLLLSAVALSLVLSFLTTRLIVVVTILALLLASLGPAPKREYNAVMPPMLRILSGQVWHAGDASAAFIVDHVGEDVLIWNSGDPDEGYINYWLLDFGKAGLGEDTTLRSFAITGYRELRDTGSSSPGDVAQLCPLIPLLGPDATIYTQDTSLARHIAEQCDGAQPRVIDN